MDALFHAAALFYCRQALLQLNAIHNLSPSLLRFLLRLHFLRPCPVLACHLEQALLAPRGIWASRASCRVSCDTIIARLARFLIATNCLARPRFSGLFGSIHLEQVPQFHASLVQLRL